MASVHVLGAVRAYVGGESRWSKARSLTFQLDVFNVFNNLSEIDHFFDVFDRVVAGKD